MSQDDLDALIGEIRLEAARRRAAPDFPVDEDARLTAELDRLGPVGAGADLASVTAALRTLEGHPERPVAELAGLAASAVAALSARLAYLERHTASGATGRPGPGSLSGPPDPVNASRWAGQLAAASPGGGRVLVAGTGAREWVESLAAAGLDAYGVDPGLEPYGDRGAVRSGPVLEHLRTVGAGGLVLAVVTGPRAPAEAEQLPALAAELARVTVTAAVHSEATWAWRARVGEAAADTSPARPVGPEAWLAALTGAGFAATAVYGPGGRDYLLTAQVDGTRG